MNAEHDGHERKQAAEVGGVAVADGLGQAEQVALGGGRPDEHAAEPAIRILEQLATMTGAEQLVQSVGDAIDQVEWNLSAEHRASIRRVSKKKLFFRGKCRNHSQCNT